ncbi:hypothetical protein [Ornithinibacillus sp. FSL M8-0202]|uniref:hypothetical protein n=1 Tax=Ornithinibacillus sp. FSL M8-0202 TaxID=2921616 RepID=UPI0030CDE68F
MNYAILLFVTPASTSLIEDVYASGLLVADSVDVLLVAPPRGNIKYLILIMHL